MKKIKIGAFITVMSFVILAGIISLPPEASFLKRVAIIFFSVIGGISGILQIIDFINKYKKGNKIENNEVKIIPTISTKNDFNDNKSVIDKETIYTHGEFSPGKVGGNYRIRKDISNEKGKENIPALSENDKTKEPITIDLIKTYGDFSPGKIDGDFTIDK